MTGKQKSKTPIEREENEDLEVDEGLPESGTSKAEEGLAETPEKTGGEPKVVRRKSANKWGPVKPAISATGLCAAATPGLFPFSWLADRAFAGRNRRSPKWFPASQQRTLKIKFLI